MFDNDTNEIYGRVYYDESTGSFRYHCSRCSTSFSAGDEHWIDDKADKHEDWHWHRNL